MSVGPISGSGNTDVAALQKQVESEQTGGIPDQRAVDQTRPPLDQAAAEENGPAPRGQYGLGAAVDLYL